MINIKIYFLIKIFISKQLQMMDFFISPDAEI